MYNLVKKTYVYVYSKQNQTNTKIKQLLSNQNVLSNTDILFIYLKLIK